MQLLNLSQTQAISGGDYLAVDVSFDYALTDVLAGLQESLTASGVNYQFDTASLFLAMSDAALDPTTYFITIGGSFTYND